MLSIFQTNGARLFVNAVIEEAGEADLLLGCDLVVAASEEALAKQFLRHWNHWGRYP